MPSGPPAPECPVLLPSKLTGPRDGAGMPRQGLSASVKSEVAIEVSANEQSVRVQCLRPACNERLSAQILQAIEHISERSLSGTLAPTPSLHRHGLEETPGRVDELINAAARSFSATRALDTTRSGAAPLRAAPSNFASLQRRSAASTRPTSEERPPVSSESSRENAEEATMNRANPRQAPGPRDQTNNTATRTPNDGELLDAAPRTDGASRTACDNVRDSGNRSTGQRDNRKKAGDDARPGEPRAVTRADAAAAVALNSREQSDARPPSPRTRDSRSRRPTSTSLTSADRNGRTGESGPSKRLRGPDGRFVRSASGGGQAAARSRVRDAAGSKQSQSSKQTQSRAARVSGHTTTSQEKGSERNNVAPVVPDLGRRPAKPPSSGGRPERRGSPSSNFERPNNAVVGTATGNATAADGSTGASFRVGQRSGAADSTQATGDTRVTSHRTGDNVAVSDDVPVPPAREETRDPGEAVRVIEALCQAVTALQELRSHPSETAGPSQPAGSGGGFWGCLCVGWGTPPPSMSPGVMTQAPHPSRFQWNIGRPQSGSGPSTVAPTVEPSVTVTSSLAPSSCSNGGVEAPPFDTTILPAVGDCERVCSTSSSVGDFSPSRRVSVEPPSCADPNRPQEDTIRELDQWLRLLRAPLLPAAEKWRC
ncbi:hypothetical protein TGDOM2_270060 [Toxoplasma gondii GAB2-2007-GAL-DOM2]|uniref:Uncharacterized protein n=5 Tax=Toxoplasma gondii TaxID=5811 RepID=S7V3Y4_TOXGG|nr:hypothetical protein TGGT1_270060 [Toxoplasma gondii GT1]KAF4642314.1 hypothetical protein TGRH88_081290 [Toxoplasma gondii]KFG43799.1 hypothetical protein TGDOM2_270060 [Toxoplasma gondii GAB2-2007-GAL-DOM2]KFG54431.1 hypothetical protein TGFOU_270060 [Toxoplasma gondii FOU]RQX75217.1 hypothetical protein TGCAST_270060 [Toxoplasma gondii CAST]